MGLNLRSYSVGTRTGVAGVGIQKYRDPIVERPKP